MPYRVLGATRFGTRSSPEERRLLITKVPGDGHATEDTATLPSHTSTLGSIVGSIAAGTPIAEQRRIPFERVQPPSASCVRHW